MDGAPRALVGGVDEVSLLPYVAFHQIHALGTHGRPFDIDRDGLIYGESAAFVVLESLRSARSRGVRIYGQLLGVGYGNDAHHLVAAHPEGTGAALAIQRVLAQTQLAATQVDYINAHGTGTLLNEPIEAKAIHAVFGRHTSSVAVSSTKGSTGHTMAAASATEAVLTVMALHRGSLPPTTGLRHQDPHIDLDVIIGKPPAAASWRSALQWLWFGGNNAVAAFARHPRPTRRLSPRPVYVAATAALLGRYLGTTAVLQRIEQATPLGQHERQAEFDLADILGKRGLRHVDRSALLLAATLEHELPTWPKVDKTRAGAVIGSAYPAYASILSLAKQVVAQGPTKVNPATVPFASSNSAAAWLLIRKGVTGFNASITSGRCSGLDAIAYAAKHIAHGEIDALIAGGVEPRTPELWQSYQYPGAPHYPTESISLVSLVADPTDALAQIDHACAAFYPHTPAAKAAPQIAHRCLEACGLRRVDLIVSIADEPVAGLPGERVRTLNPIIGETFAVGGALGVVLAVALLNPPSKTLPLPTAVLVLTTSPEGYASAVLLSRPHQRSLEVLLTPPE
ncbi:MAG: beta-ketoacyl synthase N-terminal-like domain-containing protein [Myxococcota bacterium]